METIEYALPAGTLLKGKDYNYEIKKALGQGSFGITYQAVIRIHGNLGELPTMVAVKEFFMENTSIRGNENEVYAVAGKETHAYYMRKFWEEAHKLAKMEYSGIVKVLEIFSQHGTYYYAMEYLPGGTLNDRIKDSKPLTLREILGYTEKIAYALKYMHEHEHPMLHLDLKPDNIMLNTENSPVLIDFGLAKHFDKNGNAETGTSIGQGTIGYAPPEQLEYQSTEGIQPKMDVYALGATLYKLLTGKTPPTSSVLVNNPKFLKENLRLCQVPESVIDLVNHAMQLKSDDRTADMEEFLQELIKARACIKEDILNLPFKRLTDVGPAVSEETDPEAGKKFIHDDVKVELQPVENGNSEDDEVTKVDVSDAGKADIKSESAENKGDNQNNESEHQEESGNNDSNDNGNSGGTGLSVEEVKPVTIKSRLMKYKNHLMAGVAVLVFGVCVLLLSQRVTPEEKFRQAETHYSAGEYGQAVALFTELAQVGHAPSQWYLGKCNETGQGIEANAAAAFEWYMKAAGQKYDKAIYDLALCYEKGIGTDVDEDKAMELYGKSADDAATRALERMKFQFGLNLNGMEVLLNSDNNDSCRITAVTVDYDNMGNHFSVSYPIADPKSVRLIPKGNCDIHFTYQYKNRAEKRDSVSFDFNGKLEQMIIGRNENFIGKILPADREIVVWLSENEGYNEVPTLDYLNSMLNKGYTIHGFTPMKKYSSQSLEDILDYRKGEYNPIEELYLRKK